MNDSCPICGFTDAVRTDSRERAQITHYQCACCGGFEMSAADSNRPIKTPHLLSHFLRTRFEQTGRSYLFSDRDERSSFPADLTELSVTEKLNQTLLYLSQKTPAFGKASTLNEFRDWPLVQARGQFEMANMINYWRTEDALTVGPEGGCVLTGKGWRTAEELRPSQGSHGTQAFVAMSFSKDMVRAYDDAIEPTLRRCGWTPVRLDRQQFGEKICDRILTDIRRSGLLVVECTGSKPNVYFEAGFAMGLGIPIVWCVRKEELDNERVAFDTRQYPHLDWSDERELAQKLEDRIRALHPTESPG